MNIDEAIDARLARHSPEQLGCGLQIPRRYARFLNHEMSYSRAPSAVVTVEVNPWLPWRSSRYL
jgi:hypothetical protein